MRTLKSYRQSNGIRQSDLASSLGVDQTTISKLEAGTIRPGLDLAFAIERQTDGAVPASCWLEPQQPEAAE